MKVRISDNHLRVRLSKVEADRLGDGESVTCSISMAVGHELSFLVLTEKTMPENVALGFDGTRMLVSVAVDQLGSLLSGELSSITKIPSKSQCGVTIEVDIH
jgi:hypothetical protein